MYFPVYPKQLEFLDATEHVKGFVAGQGAGKSRIGSYDLLCRVKPGRLYSVITPTYPMLRDASFRTFKEVAELTGQWIPGRFSKTEFITIVRTQQGGTAEILFRSADNPDALRGPNLSGVWMDEASLLEHEAYQIAVARLREANEQGFLTATFTPKGRSHWTFEVFGCERPGVKLVHASTRDNPFVDQGFVERVYAEYAGLRARQELGGEFVSVEGAEWPPEYFEKIHFANWPATVLVNGQPMPFLVVKAVAHDPSKGRQDKPGDYAATVWGGVDRQGGLWVDADLTKKRTTSQQLDALVALHSEWDFLGIGIEKVQFQELMLADLKRLGAARGVVLPVYGFPNTQPKQTRILSLTPELSQGRLHVKDTPGGRLLVQQLMEFPEAQYNDGPDALEMLRRLVRYLLGERKMRDAPAA